MPAGELNTAKERVAAGIRGATAKLVALSRAIHGAAEPAFAERRSAASVATTLASAGFEVRTGAYGLDTAVEAEAGDGPFVVAFCAEYDALPGIGHGCGHNLIAASSVGAAIGLAKVAHELGICVRLLGTPAEEHGGGKVMMLERGAWDDVSMSLMAHPNSGPELRCADYRSLAVDRFDVTFTGRSAHAAAAPDRGVNAADAATVALTAIGLLRQQVRDGARLNAFIAEAGTATNLIPDRAVVRVEVRDAETADLESLRERVVNCFAAGALATGCTYAIEPSEPRYLGLRQHPRLAAAWDANFAALDRDLTGSRPFLGGSTDMGNVSQVVPSIHPAFSIPSTSAVLHTREFADAAITDAAHRAMLDVAVALAATAVDAVGSEAELRSRPGALLPKA